MNERKKPKSSSPRYGRPDLKTETLEDLKLLSFLIGEIPLPEGGEDAWLWEEARTITGKPMHRLLLAAIRAAVQEDYFLQLEAECIAAKGGPPLQTAFANARTEIFEAICNRALKRGDIEFFRHLADCMSFVIKGTGKKMAEPFKQLVLRSYQLARSVMFCAFGAKLPERERKLAYQKLRPTWLDIRGVMESRGMLPDGFIDKDIEVQRRQIEGALDKLGLPFARKRQAP